MKVSFGMDVDVEGLELGTAAEEETLCLVVDLFTFKMLLFKFKRLVLCTKHRKIKEVPRLRPTLLFINTINVTWAIFSSQADLSLLDLVETALACSTYIGRMGLDIFIIGTKDMFPNGQF